MNKPFCKTTKELAELGLSGLPGEMKSSDHLIYSSPATLYFNSPGAKGFGVKRAGLAVPESVMLLVSPGCCGRNTSLFRTAPEYKDKFFFQLLDDTDIVTGRHLTKIPQAAEELLEVLKKKPSAIMICITCVDALLGTDMERVCRKVTEKTGVPAVACYMYALTREMRLPPMAAVRTSVYSLLEKQEKRNSADINIMGYFTPLFDSSEIYLLMRSLGVKNIRELSRCETFDDYSEMSKANFNLVLNPEARAAAQNMQERLGIPFIELLRLYRIDKIHNQYKSLGDALGAKLDDSVYYQNARKTIDDFRAKYGALTFSVGEITNADPIELSLMLVEEGFKVSEIFATVGELNFRFLKRLAQLSPDTKVYSNLSPTMMDFGTEHSKSLNDETSDKDKIDICIGSDAMYYHPDKPAVEWCDDNQPFGYDAVIKLFERLDEMLSRERNN
ncbi:nitrogenase molybdenum-cofactor synthesis protein NifE [Lachnospiraceae bacterium NE2001]|nr:nitrogenase molybdenum-cofactor synthesis protein NifE [Lachnospiraceae bacterium NE2001]